MRENVRFTAQILSGLAAAFTIYKNLSPADPKGGPSMLALVLGVLSGCAFIWLSWNQHRNIVSSTDAFKSQCRDFIHTYKKLREDYGVDAIRNPRSIPSWPNLTSEKWSAPELLMFSTDRSLCATPVLNPLLRGWSRWRSDYDPLPPALPFSFRRNSPWCR